MKTQCGIWGDRLHVMHQSIVLSLQQLPRCRCSTQPKFPCEIWREQTSSLGTSSFVLTALLCFPLPTSSWVFSWVRTTDLSQTALVSSTLISGMGLLWFLSNYPGDGNPKPTTHEVDYWSLSMNSPLFLLPYIGTNSVYLVSDAVRAQ